MRLLRDRLFKFETEVNWFEQEYLENIENGRVVVDFIEEGDKL